MKKFSLVVGGIALAAILIGGVALGQRGPGGGGAQAANEPFRGVTTKGQVVCLDWRHG
jgi:hypothetical protein